MAFSIAMVPTSMAAASAPLTRTDQTIRPRFPKTRADVNRPTVSASASSGTTRYQYRTIREDHRIIPWTSGGSARPVCPA